MQLIGLKIGQRVSLGFGVVVLTIVVMASAILSSLSHGATISAAMSVDMRLSDQATQTQLLAKDNANASLLVLVSSSADLQARLKREISARDVSIATNLKELEAASSGLEEQAALVAEARKRHTTYVAGVKRIVDMVTAGKQAEAAFAADEEMIPMMTPFLGALLKVEELLQAKVIKVQTESSGLSKSTWWITVAAGLASVVLAIGAGVLVTRSITQPLSHALNMAERVASGDLTATVEVRGEDEVAQLLRALNGMAQRLSELVLRVRQLADGVATASEQIASGNSDLSHRTEHQATTLQQTAASMEELSSTVAQNADNARQADELARGASSVAEQGGNEVGQVIHTMKGIESSSRKIADIISVIDGIAFQTNILALNAAVEAARAGDQGRGFAVVATEVRSLAQRSANAAKEIKSLINASVQRVGEGTALVDRAGLTMQEVVKSIGRVSQIMTEMSSAAREQRAGVAQVGQAVTQIDQTTQQNAALVEQSAAAAEGLRDQAQQLVQTVAAFKLA